MGVASFGRLPHLRTRQRLVGNFASKPFASGFKLFVRFSNETSLNVFVQMDRMRSWALLKNDARNKQKPRPQSHLNIE